LTKHEGVEPGASFRAFATQQFQTFVALQQAGFTERQALQIIGMTLAALASTLTPPEDDDK
jgi:hypothetical protein